jgi:hypothetical protein
MANHLRGYVSNVLDEGSLGSWNRKRVTRLQTIGITIDIGEQLADHGGKIQNHRRGYTPNLLDMKEYRSRNRTKHKLLCRINKRGTTIQPSSVFLYESSKQKSCSLSMQIDRNSESYQKVVNTCNGDKGRLAEHKLERDQTTTDLCA